MARSTHSRGMGHPVNFNNLSHRPVMAYLYLVLWQAQVYGLVESSADDIDDNSHAIALGLDKGYFGRVPEELSGNWTLLQGPWEEHSLSQCWQEKGEIQFYDPILYPVIPFMLLFYFTCICFILLHFYYM